MRSPSIVALEPWPDALLQLPDRGVALEVNVLVFKASPKPLNEHVVHPPPLAVHTHGDPQTFEPSRALAWSEELGPGSGADGQAGAAKPLPDLKIGLPLIRW